MSHTTGTVTFKDGEKLWFEFNGTMGICESALYETFDEMNDNWRNHEQRKCACNNHEEVEIYTSFADGETWDGRACRSCKCITRGITPFSY
ncbi:hypothetical protein ABD87_22650 [Lysinibacillus sphaericus]|uniref:hypothetical protein n=1 Tax=Lysinibacillus sphaericus TaxID=1421 RepID=UPI0018CF4C8D|nr:hypothetical protein [Lysinibacillus sphaericus]MBG9732227.1 hypothetical protein [Lysinibacillus sphaericus]